MRTISYRPIFAIIITICFLVSCEKNDNKPVGISDISIKTTPIKIDYFDGDHLDLSGLVITISMDNSTVEDIVFSDFLSKGITCLPNDGNVLNKETTVVTIMHTATGKHVSLPINVIEVELTKILVKTPPEMVDYYLDEVLDLSGLLIELTYNNGNIKNLTFSDFANERVTCSPINGTLLSAASTEVIITHYFSGLSTKQPIKVSEVITDIDNNTYSFTKIGDQLWMAENLKTTRFNDGKTISLVSDNTEWDELTEPGFCWYDNNEVAYAEAHGALYNWYTVETEKLCPSGWHVPTQNEWNELIRYLRDNGYDEIQGTALKTTTGWDAEGNGTDDYGFKALPAGSRWEPFSGLGYSSSWWTATANGVGSSSALARRVHSAYKYVDGFSTSKTYGFSIRCLRD